MKKIISIVLVIVLVLQISVLADNQSVKKGENLNLSVISQEFPDAYIEQIYLYSMKMLS